MIIITYLHVSIKMHFKARSSLLQPLNPLKTGKPKHVPAIPEIRSATLTSDAKAIFRTRSTTKSGAKTSLHWWQWRKRVLSFQSKTICKTYSRFSKRFWCSPFTTRFWNCFVSYLKCIQCIKSIGLVPSRRTTKIIGRANLCQTGGGGEARQSAVQCLPFFLFFFPFSFFFSKILADASLPGTLRSPNMVRTVRRTILRFLTDLLMSCKLRPELPCAGCTQTRVYILTHDTCSLSSIRGRKPRHVDAAAVPRANLFISLYLLGPTDNADPPTSPQTRPFPPKRKAKRICPFESVRRNIRRTRRTVLMCPV